MLVVLPGISRDGDPALLPVEQVGLRLDEVEGLLFARFLTA
jgi:hypothetical protein